MHTYIYTLLTGPLAFFFPGQGNKEPHRLASVNKGNTNHIHNLYLSLHDRTCSELFITSPFKKNTYYWALHWYIGGQTNPVSPNKWLFFPSPSYLQILVPILKCKHSRSSCIGGMTCFSSSPVAECHVLH